MSRASARIFSNLRAPRLMRMFTSGGCFFIVYMLPYMRRNSKGIVIHRRILASKRIPCIMERDRENAKTCYGSSTRYLKSVVYRRVDGSKCEGWKVL